ncbi:hypothetical protein MESS2_p60019 [Mesorhizobium metallidurans STM 2683]|uniref:Transposase DDE domain-containing protein n=1 Tax=Mesorhizobium metallidurans STM 2683 TaxID=1297569 RepID=M5EZP7_9HYPH|nr:hypothetical protein MESS2_p60019 [Mesorhizobium metallidurans STM 2683]
MSSWRAPKRTTRGGQPRYSDLAIETALTLGLVFGLRLRQTEGLLASVLQLMGMDLAVPDHTTLSRRAGISRLPDRRQGRRFPEDGPVHVLIDSTGLEIHGAGQWLEEKHGARSRRSWRKLHLALDADSGEIIAHVMTDQDTGDARRWSRCSTRSMCRSASSRPMAPMTARQPTRPSPTIATVQWSSFRRAQTQSSGQMPNLPASGTGI